MKVQHVTVDECRDKIRHHFKNTGLTWQEIQEFYTCECGSKHSGWEYDTDLDQIENYLFLLDEPRLSDHAPEPDWLKEAP